MKKGFSRYDELTRFYDSQHDTPRISDLAQLLEKYGYCLYMWKNPHASMTVRQAHEKGFFADGIPLTRIGQPLWLRQLKEQFSGPATE